MSDDEWIDTTLVNSTHEIQYNMATGEYRHRPFTINRYAVTRCFPPDNVGIEDWTPGHPDVRREAKLEESRAIADRRHEEWD